MGTAAGGRAEHGPGDAPNGITDYEQTVAVINMLTEVRFKLAAFVPLATGAAVALIRGTDVAPLAQFVLGVGGLVFVLGIVLYDLRNNQHYNNAIGRATALEVELFGRYGGDRHAGLFGSRQDSLRVHVQRGTDRFLGLLPVRHGAGLALVYAATIGAWVWVVLDALARRVRSSSPQDWQPAEWVQADNHAGWLAAGLSILVAALFGWRYHRHDSPRSPRPVVKLTFCLRRRPGLSTAEFQEYWREQHAPLVSKHAKLLRIRRYVQVHTADVPGLHGALQERNGGAPEPFDGVAELWFDSFESFNGGGRRARAARDELLADERRFIDLANSPMWLGVEEAVVAGERRWWRWRRRR